MNPPFYIAWGRVCAGCHLRVKRAFSGRTLDEPLAHAPKGKEKPLFQPKHAARSNKVPHRDAID
jgi:hypothetical protein